MAGKLLEGSQQTESPQLPFHFDVHLKSLFSAKRNILVISQN